MDRLRKQFTLSTLALLMIVAPGSALTQDAPKAPKADKDKSDTVMPPRREYYNEDGEIVGIEFQDRVLVPPIIIDQAEIARSVEEALEHAEYVIEGLELDAFDLEMQAFDLESDMMNNYEYSYDMQADMSDVSASVFSSSRSRSSRKGLVDGQEPKQDALPRPRTGDRSSSRGPARSYPRTPEGNNQRSMDKAAEREALKATYQAAYSLVLDSKWAESGAAMQVFVQNNFNNRYTDDATFWFAYSLEKQENTTERVFDAYYAFVAGFPSSSWADDAKANLIRIGSALVKSDAKNRSKYEPILTSLQEDNDIEVAISALYGLSRIGDASSMRALIKIYDENENEVLRKNVVSTLARFDDELVVDKLGQIAKDDPNEEVRSSAFSALARSDHPRALRFLQEIAITADDSKMRSKAINALGRGEGTPEVIKVLETVARNDIHVKVRTNAVSALGRLGTPEAQEALIRILSGN